MNPRLLIFGSILALLLTVNAVMAPVAATSIFNGNQTVLFSRNSVQAQHYRSRESSLVSNIRIRDFLLAVHNYQMETPAEQTDDDEKVWDRLHKMHNPLYAVFSNTAVNTIFLTCRSSCISAHTIILRI
jgi:hypothetical protein